MSLISKLICFVSAAVLAAVSLVSCWSAPARTVSSGRLNIICTDFSEYDWTRVISEGSGTTDIRYLLESGTDIHNYQPSAQDMLDIAGCDLFIYVGGESESWVDDALKNSSYGSRKVLKLFDVLGQSVKTEELKYGMETHENGIHDDGPEYDEHVWLSLKNADIICGSICDCLCRLDPANSGIYRSNLENYRGKLKALDADYRSMSDGTSSKTLIFGDRFPFRYLTDDYGFDYYAAFSGCSAETEASFDTIARLSEKLNELELDTVFIIESSDDSIARSVITNSGNTGASIETLDSIQSVSRDDIGKGASYISIMRKNLETLKKVLY